MTQDPLAYAKALLREIHTPETYRRRRWRRTWWSKSPARLHALEANLTEASIVKLPPRDLDDHPVIRGLRRAHGWTTVRGYRFIAETPAGPLRAAILVPGGRPEDTVVACLDEPHGAEVASPHRNGRDDPGGYELCLFYPRDPVGRRWEPAMGLGVLADMARAHLNREFIWRLEGYWPGDEAPHGYQEAA